MTHKHNVVRALILVLLSLLVVGKAIPARATDVLAGDVSGFWSRSDSPYHVKGDITVQPGDTLTIESGVIVYFDGNYSLTVIGKIHAVGTSTDEITFSWRDGGTQRNNWRGIVLQSTTVQSTISYCKIMNAVTAIHISGSLGNMITHNTIRYNTEGILIDSAEGNSILDNEIYENSRFGVCVQRGSQRNEISRNQIYKTGSGTDPDIVGHGILFRGGQSQNVDNKIKDNTIYNNYLTGIRVDHVQTLEISGNLIYMNWRFQPTSNTTKSTGGNILLAEVLADYMTYCNRDVTIYNNRIHTALNNGTGIYIQNATNVFITYNDIYSNDGAGIAAARGANLIQVHHNDVRNNKIYHQAWDIGTTNNWDDGSKGNYWSAYNGTDMNNDGIGDTPFQLYPLYKGSKDSFPLMHPLFFIATTTYSTTTATSTVPILTTTSSTTTRFSTTTIETGTSTTNTTTTIATTSTVTTASTQTVIGTFTSYYFTVSTPTTIFIFITSSSSTSTTTTMTTTSTSVSTTFTTTTVTATLTTETTPRRCLIASAAFGSELAPAVAALRELRDHEISQTFAGKNFIAAFNNFYYSFSPTIADCISTNDLARTATRAALMPLLASLGVGKSSFQLLDASREAAGIVCGIVVSALVGITYSAPLIAVNELRKKRQKGRHGFSLKYLGFVWVGALGILVIGELMFWVLGELMWSSFLVMTGSATLVLATVILAPLIVLKLVRTLLP